MRDFSNLMTKCMSCCCQISLLGLLFWGPLVAHSKSGSSLDEIYQEGALLLTEGEDVEALARMRYVFYQVPWKESARKGYFLALEKNKILPEGLIFEKITSHVPPWVYQVSLLLFLMLGIHFSFQKKRFHGLLYPALPLLFCLFWNFMHQNPERATLLQSQNFLLDPHQHAKVEFHMNAGSFVKVHTHFRDWIFVSYKDNYGWAPKASFYLGAQR